MKKLQAFTLKHTNPAQEMVFPQNPDGKLKDFQNPEDNHQKGTKKWGVFSIPRWRKRVFSNCFSKCQEFDLWILMGYRDRKTWGSFTRKWNLLPKKGLITENAMHCTTQDYWGNGRWELLAVIMVNIFFRKGENKKIRGHPQIKFYISN